MRYDCNDYVGGVSSWIYYRLCMEGGVSILVEQMIRITLPKYVVRVWRQQNEEYEHKDEGISDVEFEAQKNQELHPKALALSLLLLPNVNAVEVLDWERGGIVVYNDWP